jgi:hypothetical protein
MKPSMEARIILGCLGCMVFFYILFVKVPQWVSAKSNYQVLLGFTTAVLAVGVIVLTLAHVLDLVRKKLRTKK